MNRGLLVLAVAAGAAVLGYAGTLGHGFVWDDTLLVEKSHHLRRWGSLPGLLGTHFWAETQAQSHYYRPVVTLSFFLDARLWGVNPQGFHLTNVLAHAGAAAAVAALGWRVLGTALGAALAGVLFALHPLHTESVAFVSGRTDVLAALFALLATVGYARWRQTGSRRDRWASVGAFALAVGAKEVAVTLPLALLLYDALVARRPAPAPAAGGGSPSLAGRQGPYLGVLAVYFLVRGAVLGRPVALAESAPWAAAEARVLTTVEMAAWYAWKTLLPVRADAYPVVTPVTWPPSAGWWLALALVGALAALTALAVRHGPSSGLAALWFWVTLAPSLAVNLLPLSAPILAERFAYLPSVGFCLLAGGALARWLGPAEGALRAPLRPVPAVALLVVLLAYTGLTLWRNEDWRDEQRLFSRMLDTSPGVALPLVNLALVEMRQGRILEAHGRLEAAVELAPGNPKALAGLALTETLLGRPERGLALALRARAAAPRDPNILATVGSVHLYRREPEAALGYLEESLRLNPHQVHPALNRALGLAKLGRWPEAEEALDRALPLVEAMSPGLPLAQRVAAEVYGGRDPARARAAWERYIAALSAQPDPGPAVEADLRYARRELARLSVAR